MNALTPFPSATDATPALPATRADGSHESTTFVGRADGWTPDRQRTFLEHIAQGDTVEAACRRVGLSVASAYALRRRAAGASFALGWRAATLVARDHVADTLIARALDGQVDTYTRADGSEVTRHRYDNRLATTLLARLDRQADTPQAGPGYAAARIVAQDFDRYLDIVGADAGPARAGLFLVQSAGDPDLAPVAALARADCWLRTGAARAVDVDTSDLDPAARAGWSADQWARAEAAGLLAFAAPPKTAPEPQLPQLRPDPDEDRGPVWWCDHVDGWRTSFPPPDDFDGEEEGEYGDEDYERALTEAEEALVDAPWQAEVEARRSVESLDRDEYFSELAASMPLPSKGGDRGGSAPSEEASEEGPTNSPPLAKHVLSACLQAVEGPVPSDDACNAAGRARPAVLSGTEIAVLACDSLSGPD